MSLAPLLLRLAAVVVATVNTNSMMLPRLTNQIQPSHRLFHSRKAYSSSRDLIKLAVLASASHNGSTNIVIDADVDKQPQSQSERCDSNDQNGNQNQGITVSFETKNQTKTIRICRGETLRTALLKSGISPHNGQARLINCRGLGTCGTCAVEVISANTNADGNSDSSSSGSNGDFQNDENKRSDSSTSDDAIAAIQPMKRTTMENMRLNFPPHGSNDQSSNLRLACQIQIYDDVHVTKKSGFWGQSSEKGDLAEEFDAKLYFGDLEYILDNKSPTRTNTNDK